MLLRQRCAWLAGLSSCSMCQTKDRDRERRSGHFRCFPHPCGHSHLHQPTNRPHRHSDFCCSIQISSDVDFSSFKPSASRWKETQSIVSWCEAAQPIERFLLPLKPAEAQEKVTDKLCIHSRAESKARLFTTVSWTSWQQINASHWCKK